MTVIHISPKFKIEIDNYNHTLMEFRGGETYLCKKDKVEKLTQPKWEVLGYYPNVEQALSALTHRFIDYGDVEGIQAYYKLVLEELKSISDYIKEACPTTP